MRWQHAGLSLNAFMTGLFPAVCVAAGAVPAAGEEQLLAADAPDGEHDEHGEHQQDEECGKIHSDPSQRQADDAHDKRRDPGNRALADDHAHGPLAAQLPLDRGDGGDARRVQQAEDQQARGG